MMKYIVALMAVLMAAMTGMAYSQEGVNTMRNALAEEGAYNCDVQPAENGEGYSLAVPSEEFIGAGIGAVCGTMVREGISQVSVVGYPTSTTTGIAYIIKPNDAYAMVSAILRGNSEDSSLILLGIMSQPIVVQY